MKKLNKPVFNYAYDFSSTIVSQLNMENFKAVAEEIKAGYNVKKSERKELKNAWFSIEKQAEEISRDIVCLCVKKKWETARADVSELKAELLSLIYSRLTIDSVKWYVTECSRDGQDREVNYLPDLGVTYKKTLREVKIDKEMVSDKNIFAFYSELVDMASIGLGIVTELQEGIRKKMYSEKWDKYAEPILSFNLIWASGEAREKALDKLVDVSVIDYGPNKKTTLIFKQEWKEAETEKDTQKRKSKKGTAIKRLLGAWLSNCERLELLDPKYSDTARALATLTFLGIPAKGENDVREMIGLKAKINDYNVRFEDWT